MHIKNEFCYLQYRELTKNGHSNGICIRKCDEKCPPIEKFRYTSQISRKIQWMKLEFINYHSNGLSNIEESTWNTCHNHDIALKCF